MGAQDHVRRTAAGLQDSIGLLVRRMRQIPIDGELTLPERAAMRWLDRCGPTTASELAKLEQISPQSMGATIAGLEQRGLVGRTADPADGRRQLLSLSASGARLLKARRGTRIDQLGRLLQTHFTDEEIETLAASVPLIERMADLLR